MGVSWSDDTDPFGLLGSRPGPRRRPAAPEPQPDSPGPPGAPRHHRRRPSGVLGRPQAAAAAVTALLTRPQHAHRRSYRRYWL
jgi:hypothetical protein